ncbi:MAG: alpha/beta fold hydrolase [Pseudomonadota bacterium]
MIRIDDANTLYAIAHAPTRAGAPTFVFVNAITGTTDHWEAAVAPALREAGFGTVSYNLRGQAGSDFAPGTELTDALIIEDLGRVAAELGGAKPILVGLSIGGLYAARAHLGGAACAGLVLLNTLREIGPRIAWVNDALPVVASRLGMAVFGDVMSPMILNPEALSGARPNAFSQDYEPLPADSGLMNIIRNSPATDWNADWAAISVPTLVVTGHCDRVFRDPEVIDRLAALIPDARREEWPDCGHMVPVERPDRLAASLKAFGAEIEA